MFKILYITMDPSPFQVELNQELRRLIADHIEIKLAFKNPLSAARSHWNKEVPDASVFIPHDKKKLFEYLDSYNPDVVVFPEYRTKVAWRIRSWVKSRKKQLIVGPSEKLNEFETSTYVQHLLYRIYKQYVKGAAGVIAIGNNALRKFQACTTLPVVNIPYTFNMSSLLERRRGPQQEAFTFLISGRLEPFRDPLYGIRLFAKLKSASDRPLRLMISGKGSLYDACLAEIDKLGIANEVSWRNEFKNWKDIHNIYFDADALICMQEYSGWGIIIQEAMAAGMLVISNSWVEAADQLIIDGYNGLLLNKGNHSIVVDTILDTIQKPDLVAAMGINARSSVQSTDLAPMAEKMVAFFETVTNRKLSSAATLAVQ